jgi:hypothetical protein
VTKQEFLHLYGKSVYQVYLEMACQTWFKVTPKECLQTAHDFVKALLEEDVEELKGRYD